MGSDETSRSPQIVQLFPAFKKLPISSNNQAQLGFPKANKRPIKTSISPNGLNLTNYGDAPASPIFFALKTRKKI